MLLAEAIYQKHGLKTRWFVGDGGFETVEAAGLVDAGIVEPLFYNLRAHPLETTRMITEGYWPKDPADPKSPWQTPDREKLAKEVGFWVFEGLAPMSRYLMGNAEGGLSDLAAKGALEKREAKKKYGEKADAGVGGGLDSPYVVQDGDIMRGGVSMSGFGFTQKEILDLVERSHILPGWVYWTSWERAINADDNDDRPEPIGGPEVAGKALTGTIGGSFGNTIHMVLATREMEVEDKVTKKRVKQQKVEHRAYTRPHYDPDQKSFIKWYANNRMPVTQKELMPDYIYPADPLVFYAKLEEGKRLHAEARAARAAAVETL
jgi:hypothetical protein